MLKDERQRFLDKEWPLIVATIDRLGLGAEDLLAEIAATRDAGKGENE